jgi:hypothetical protein
MSSYQDEEIAIWVCRHGNSADVVEFPVGEREPVDQACASHGEAFVRRCPNKKCPAPIYHRTDLDRRFHHCGEQIPWAESRAETARVMMEHDPFNSKFVGRPKPVPGIFESLLSTTFNTRPPRDLTPRERQDLITPPSGRLPVESVRIAEVKKKEPPRVSGTRGTGSKLSQPDLRPGNVEGALPDDSSGGAPTAPKLSVFKSEQPKTPGEPIWKRGLTTFGKYLLGVAVGLTVLLVGFVIRSYLKSQGLDVP